VEGHLENRLGRLLRGELREQLTKAAKAHRRLIREVR
jgi:hypothetical protein